MRNIRLKGFHTFLQGGIFYRDQLCFMVAFFKLAQGSRIQIFNDRNNNYG
jgi:hypothetical protein